MDKKDRNEQLKILQSIEIEILKAVVEALEKLNLNYYISDGTMLGAVRHKGFIPWDDDIDISMPRKDYEVFVAKGSEYLPKTLRLVNFKKNKDCIDYMTKIVDDRYKLLHTHPKNNRLMSVWVDIFPLDGMPNTKLASKIHGLHLMYLRAKFKLSLFDDIVNITNVDRPWYEKVLIVLGKHINFQKIFNYRRCMVQLDKSLQKYDYYKSQNVISFMGAYKLKSIMPRSVYGEGTDYDFEGLKIRGVEDYEMYLTTLYGDYMKLPPEGKRNWHGNEIVQL